MITGMSQCPFCEEEIYCKSSVTCQCKENHWLIYEEFKCPHCGKFNMCIDRRNEKVRRRLRALQADAADENVEANQNAQWILWTDVPLEQVICDTTTRKAIEEGYLVPRRLEEFE